MRHQRSACGRRPAGSCCCRRCGRRLARSWRHPPGPSSASHHRSTGWAPSGWTAMPNPTAGWRQTTCTPRCRHSSHGHRPRSAGRPACCPRRSCSRPRSPTPAGRCSHFPDRHVRLRAERRRGRNSGSACSRCCLAYHPGWTADWACCWPWPVSSRPSSRRQQRTFERTFSSCAVVGLDGA